MTRTGKMVCSTACSPLEHGGGWPDPSAIKVPCSFRESSAELSQAQKCAHAVDIFQVGATRHDATAALTRSGGVCRSRKSEVSWTIFQESIDGVENGHPGLP